MKKIIQTITVAASIVILVACGGGGGGGDTAGSGTTGGGDTVISGETIDCIPRGSFTVNGETFFEAGSSYVLPIFNFDSTKTFCPEGPSGCLIGSSNDGYTLLPDGGVMINEPTTTQAVNNYINMRHENVQPSFLITADTTENKHFGSLCGGNHLAESIDNYMTAVQSFLNDSVTNARSLNAIFPVDSASVATLLRTYKTQDANFVSTYYGAWKYGTVSVGFINDAKTRVNSAYDAAITNLR
ncbi:hypothetical protein [Limnohabitans sp. Rim8]|uniref:hypothetical protein n=1 Tax=Limnohabitans sp. Rim8 TaxID=1100718 RepID=UPI0025F55178|nr:hypothetical protein [Limnohabitans sp. Rim8]